MLKIPEENSRGLHAAFTCWRSISIVFWLLYALHNSIHHLTAWLQISQHWRIPWNRKKIHAVQSRFLEPPWEGEIGSKNQEVQEIESKITEKLSRGKENWFEKSGGLKNQGFEKSGFQCINYWHSIPIETIILSPYNSQTTNLSKPFLSVQTCAYY